MQTTQYWPRVELFPWFREDQIKRLEEKTAHMPEGVRQQSQQELYRQLLPKVIAKQWQEQRMGAKNEFYQKNLQKPSEQRQVGEIQLRQEDLADMIKGHFGLRHDLPTEETMQGFQSLMQEEGVEEQLLLDYLNGKNEDLLYQVGMKEKSYWGKFSESMIWGITNMVKGAKWLAGKAVGLIAGFDMNAFDKYIESKYGKWVLNIDDETLEKESEYIRRNPEVLEQFSTSLSHDTLNYVEGVWDTMFTAFAPKLKVGMSALGSTEMGGEALWFLGKGFEWLGEKVNHTPGLSHFRGSLSEEDRKRFDIFVGQVVQQWITGTKWKGRVLKSKNIPDLKANLKLFVKENMNPAEIIGNFQESVLNIPKNTFKALKDWNFGMEKFSEIGAELITRTVKDQDKLYKAQEPRMNVLNKKKDLKSYREQSDLANMLIVEAGHKPTDTTTRLHAHKSTMESKWKEIETKVKNKSDLMVDQAPLADVLDNFIKEKEKLGIVDYQSDLEALRKQAQALRDQGLIDLPTLETKKQGINGLINNWGESKMGDVYKNGLKKLTHAIGEIENKALSSVPDEFSDLKKEFGALKATYEDVFKADMKNQRAKGMGLVESYSKIEGLTEMLWGALSIFTRGGDGVKDVLKGAGKALLWSAYGKAKNVDFLIKKGFEGLSKEDVSPLIKKHFEETRNRNQKNLPQEKGLGKLPEWAETKYQLAEPIKSENFKKWFGDWENDPKNASKVVNEKGEPLLMYHGSPEKFTIFDNEFMGLHGSSKGYGFYFSPDKNMAQWYGDLMQVYLDIKNPLSQDKLRITRSQMKKLILDVEKNIAEKWGSEDGTLLDNFGDTRRYGRDRVLEDAIDMLMENENDVDVFGELKHIGGDYDSVAKSFRKILGKDWIITPKEYIVFESNQIKSATDNIWTFDANNPDIRYQKHWVANPLEKEILAQRATQLENIRNGRSVQELADHYGIDIKTVETITTPEGLKAYGKYGDWIITLAEKIKEGTAPHELFHATFDLVDRNKKENILKQIEKSKGLDNLNAEEYLADSFSEYFRTGKFDTKSFGKGLVEKIKQYFYQVKQFITGANKNKAQIKKLFDEILDGEIKHKESIIWNKVSFQILKQEYPNLKEVGEWEFGTIYEGVKWTDAEQLLIKQQGGEVRGAYTFEKKPVDLIRWSYNKRTESGIGLSKISQKHPEVLWKIQDLLDTLPILKRDTKEIVLWDKNSVVVIKLQYLDQKKRWIMTAYDRKWTKKL